MATPQSAGNTPDNAKMASGRIFCFGFSKQERRTHKIFIIIIFPQPRRKFTPILMTFFLLVYHHTSLIKTADSKSVGFGERRKKRLFLPSSL